MQTAILCTVMSEIVR